MQIFRKLNKLLILPLILTAFVSCDKSEYVLLGISEDEAFVYTEVDWSQFDKEEVSGVTVSFYDEKGRRIKAPKTNNISHIETTLPAGTYTAIAFNQSESEFGFMHFRDMDYLDDACIVGTNQSRYDWAPSLSRTIDEPEWLAIGINYPMTVTDHMVTVSHDAPAYCPDPCCYDYNPEFPYNLGTVVMKNVIWEITIRIHINNISQLTSARGYLDGLAEGVSLKDALPLSSTIQQLLTNWEVEHDEDNPNNGTITTTILSFGLPLGRTKSPNEDNKLSLQLLLADNKTVVQSVSMCGDALIVDRDNMSISVNMSLAEELPSVSGKKGGFHAEVDDWGETEIINI